MIERRRAARRKTLLTGRIEFLDRSIFDCVIRNLGDTGAKIRCDQHIALPDMFRLFIEKKDELRDVRVVWREKDAIGLKFLSAEDSENVLVLDVGRGDLVPQQ